MSKKIKIVHILDTLKVGGSETVAINLCNNLDRTKFDVYLLVLTNDQLVQLENVNTDVNVVILPIKEKQITGLTSLLFFFNGFSLVMKSLKKINAKIIHTHSYLHRLLFIAMAIKLSKTHAVHFQTIHMQFGHYDPITIARKLKLTFERIVLKISKPNLICVSINVYNNTLTLLKGCYRNIKCIENGVDANKFDKTHYATTKQQQGFLESDFIVAYTSRLEQGKGHITLIKAIGLLKGEIPTIRLCLIGDGSQRKNLETYADKLSIYSFVTFKGSINNVAELLSICDIGAFPSESEGFGLAALEMMSMGLPMICTEIESFKNMFTDQDVLFFEVSDHVTLASLIKKMYNNSEERRFYQLQSRAMAESYSLAKSVSRHEEYYDECLK